MEDRFYLERYLAEEAAPYEPMSFGELCTRIEGEFRREWDEERGDSGRILAVQKRAIIGYAKEVAYFKDKISGLIRAYQAEKTRFPAWHASLADAVYHENWGLSGMAEWFGESMGGSSSAKIIGDRIYFLEGGVMRLKPQTISRDRREQLTRAFLLLTPDERLDREFHEIYMLDGTRVTVFRGAMTKPDQDVIIFRRYIIPSYSFEEQALRGSIPKESIGLFRSMARVGYNVAFCGPVRSAKTTFLSTWQSCEDASLEGVMVETDPEIPLHKLMPEAPVVQLIADQDKLKNISKNLLRSDADYFILAEARDGIALDTAVRMARKGTRRMKITFHTRDPLFFPYDVAVEIVRAMGGGLEETARRVAGSFDYVFHFVQLKRKDQKRLRAIYELGICPESRETRMVEICRYLFAEDRWAWTYHISEDKRLAGEEEDAEAFAEFDAALRRLAEDSAGQDSAGQDSAGQDDGAKGGGAS
ncbi:MAG: CpaF/VirB11 family protein [Clostridiales Family XIII bacterium]|nr:CpaF/VirB11 family protein [Clostridiales Family XIII bacterium]